jgi:hypothetical protein
MRSAILGVFLASGLMAAGSLPFQDQQGSTSTSEQHQKDVPQQGPGERNPDLKQSNPPHERNSPKETTTEPVNPGDIPQQRPGEKSPDLKQPAPGTTPRTSTQKRTRRHKRKSGSQSQPGATASNSSR